jgi:hypothetical protein
MKIKDARYTYAHERQVRKPRRGLFSADLISVILLLLCGYSVAPFIKDKSMLSAEAVPSALDLLLYKHDIYTRNAGIAQLPLPNNL